MTKYCAKQFLLTVFLLKSELAIPSFSFVRIIFVAYQTQGTIS